VTAIEKPCTQCGRIKPLTAYYRDRRQRLGRQSACAACCRARDRARNRALVDLVDRHRAEYEELLAEHFAQHLAADRAAIRRRERT
jgi:hypothetical protein